MKSSVVVPRIIAVAAIALLVGAGILIAQAPTVEGAAGPSTSSPAASADPKSGQQMGAGSPESYTVVVNKRRPIEPRDYVPPDLVDVVVPFVGAQPQLRRTAAVAVEKLFAAFAGETGLQMQSNSAYRSYSQQASEYATFSRTLGENGAEETTAKPGYSEHETGLAMDIGARNSTCKSRDCFGDTVQARWLAGNAWRFGFIIRYPRGQSQITGYEYEPWHIRFVGDAVAKRIHGHYSSLEAFLHLPGAPTY